MRRSIGNLSIRNKLFLPIVLFVSMTFITIQSINYTVTFEREKANLIQRVKVLAQGVAYNLQAAIVFEDKMAAEEILSAFSADQDIVRVKLYSVEDEFFAGYTTQTQEIPLLTQKEKEEVFDHQFSISKDYIFLLVPVELDGSVMANLRVTISKSGFKKISESIIETSGVYLLLLLVLGGILYKVTQRFIIDPLFQLNEAMQTFVESGKNRVTLVNNYQDEIGDLVRGFNTMQTRLSQREQQINFTLDKLQQEKAFANEVVETVQHALLVVNHKELIVQCNAATQDIFRCTAAYLDQMTIQQLLGSNAAKLINSVLQSNVDITDQLIESTSLFQEKQWLQISARSLSQSDHVLFAIQNVTEIQLAMNRQRLAAGVFEHSQDGLIVLDSEQYITMVNPAVTRMLGYHADLLVGKTPMQVFEWQQFTSLMPTIQNSLKHFGQWQGEVWENNSSGELVPMFVKVNRIGSSKEDDSFDMVLTLSDLSNVKEMERLEHLAHHDELTGLANRTQLYKYLDGVTANSRYSGSGFSIMYLDLDGFKEVNDTYGHDAGDEILKEVSNKLLSQVRAGDLVARLSGDEFVLVVKQTDQNKLSKLAQRILALIEEPVIYKQRQLNVGASIGITVSSDVENDFDALLKVADEAMYQAKREGKGCHVFA